MTGESSGCKLTRVAVDGHQTLRLENESVRIGVDLDRGAHICEIYDKRTDINLMYEDPRGLAKHVVGGWYELFPNAGRPCTFRGVSVPQHGDVRDLRWESRVEEQSAERLAVALAVTSALFPLRLERKLELRADAAVLRVSEQITNIGEEEQPYLWGHHVTFGAPFVGPDCRIDLPGSRVYKRQEYHDAGSRLTPEATGTLDDMPGLDGSSVDLRYFSAADGSEMLFVDRLDGHWYNLFNEKLGVGCALSWSGEAFPGLWLWQENRAAQGAPFNGTTTAMALEPQSSNVPILANAWNERQAPFLMPGERRGAWLALRVHHRPGRVIGVDDEGRLAGE